MRAAPIAPLPPKKKKENKNRTKNITNKITRTKKIGATSAVSMKPIKGV